MNIPAPFDHYEGEVLPEWIDANDHMNLAYYTVLFDYATDALFDVIGIGREYKDSTNKGTFVVETHNSYERDLLVGDRVRVSTQILAMDSKRLLALFPKELSRGAAASANRERILQEMRTIQGQTDRAVVLHLRAHAVRRGDDPLSDLGGGIRLRTLQGGVPYHRARFIERHGRDQLAGRV